MREGIGSIALYNIIIIFIAVTFSVLAGTMSYSKAFKTNNRIINAIEKYEGYNDYSSAQIDNLLLSIGYQVSQTNKSCPKRQNIPALQNLNPNYDFCVYQFSEKTREWDGRFSTFGVVTYINIDLPIVGDFIKIPVYGRSKMVFKFGAEADAPSIEVVQNLVVELIYDKALEFGFIGNDGLLTFKKGSTVDFDQIFKVYIMYSDGVSHQIYHGQYSVSDFDTTTEGKHRMMFYYSGMDDLFVYYDYFVE